MTPLGISFWSNESYVKINFLVYNKDRVTTSPANSPSVTFSSGATALRARDIFAYLNSTIQTSSSLVFETASKNEQHNGQQFRKLCLRLCELYFYKRRTRCYRSLAVFHCSNLTGWKYSHFDCDSLFGEEEEFLQPVDC